MTGAAIWMQASPPVSFGGSGCWRAVQLIIIKRVHYQMSGHEQFNAALPPDMQAPWSMPNPVHHFYLDPRTHRLVAHSVAQVTLCPEPITSSHCMLINVCSIWRLVFSQLLRERSSLTCYVPTLRQCKMREENTMCQKNNNDIITMVITSSWSTW